MIEWKDDDDDDDSYERDYDIGDDKDVIETSVDWYE